MEQATTGLGTMTDFEALPNKRAAEVEQQATDMWPEFGAGFVLNKFYRNYDGAEGWLGDGYLAIWSRQEVQSFREPNLEAYPSNYHFFASDGGGTQFGFLGDDRGVSFISGPDIGGKEDVRVLGSWDRFLAFVAAGDYI